MAEPYFDEILPGHDCCKDYEIPTRPLTIRPSRSVIGPLDSVRLSAKGFHLDCEPECLTWRIKSGGGSLRDEFGDETVYYSPTYNQNCANNAHIQLICGGKPIADAYVCTNTDTKPERAYIKYTQRKTIDHKTSEIKITDRTYYWAYAYDCNATLLQKRWYWQVLQTWIWDPGPKKWDKMPNTTYYEWGYCNGPDGPVACAIRGPRTMTVDMRTNKQKLRGCCPKALIGVTFFPEEKPEI